MARGMGQHQGEGVLADRLRWCGYSRAHETQTAREIWLARGGQAALSSVMVAEAPAFCSAGSVPLGELGRSSPSCLRDDQEAGLRRKVRLLYC